MILILRIKYYLILLLLSINILSATQYTPPPIPANIPLIQKKLWVLLFSEYDINAKERDAIFIIENSLKNKIIKEEDLITFFNHPIIKQMIKQGETQILDPKHSYFTKLKYNQIPFDIYQELINQLEKSTDKKSNRRFTYEEAERYAHNATASRFPHDNPSDPGHKYMSQNFYKKTLNQALGFEHSQPQKSKNKEERKILNKLINKTHKLMEQAYKEDINDYLIRNKNEAVLLEIEDGVNIFENRNGLVYFKNGDQFPLLTDNDRNLILKHAEIKPDRGSMFASQFNIIRKGRIHNVALKLSDNRMHYLHFDSIVKIKYFFKRGKVDINSYDFYLLYNTLINNLKNYTGPLNKHHLIKHLKMLREKFIVNNSSKDSNPFSSHAVPSDNPKTYALQKKFLFLKTYLYNDFLNYPVPDTANFARSIDNDGNFKSVSEVRSSKSMTINDIQTKYYNRTGTLVENVVDIGKNHSSNQHQADSFKSSVRETNIDNAQNTSQIENRSIYESLDHVQNKEIFYNLSHPPNISKKNKRHKILKKRLPSPEKLNKSSKTINLISSTYISPQRNYISLPTPDSHQLTGLKILDGHSKTLLKQGTDFKLIQNLDNPGFIVKIINPDFSNAKLIINTSFKNSKPQFSLPIREKRLNLDLKKLLPILEEVNAIGYKDLISSIPHGQKNWREKIWGKKISVGQLEEIIKNTAIYTCNKTTEFDGNYRGFRRFKRFIKAGKFNGQCDSSNLLFAEILKEYYKNDKNIDITVREGFSSNGSKLKLTDLHAQTIVKVKNRFFLFDVTPINNDGTPGLHKSPTADDTQPRPKTDTKTSVENIDSQFDQFNLEEQAKIDGKKMSLRTAQFKQEGEELKAIILHNGKMKSPINKRLKPTLLNVYRMHSFLSNYLNNGGTYSHELGRYLNMFNKDVHFIDPLVHTTIKNILQQKKITGPEEIISIIKGYLTEERLHFLDEKASGFAERSYLNLAKKTIHYIESTSAKDIDLHHLQLAQKKLACLKSTLSYKLK